MHESASHWFVLSALIVKKSVDVSLPKIRDKILKDISSQTDIIHMKEIKNHERKMYIAKSVSEIDSKCISVLSNKCTILDDKAKFTKKNRYYSYMASRFIDKISKCCSSWRTTTPEGNGKIKIIFSKRGGMNYGQFRTYLEWLKKESKTKINWNVIDIELIEAESHSMRAGLQLVDVVAYSFFKAVEKNSLEMVDCSLVNFFKNNVFKEEGKALGYGVWLVPNPSDLKKEELPTELLNVFNRHGLSESPAS